MRRIVIALSLAILATLPVRAASVLAPGVGWQPFCFAFQVDGVYDCRLEEPIASFTTTVAPGTLRAVFELTDAERPGDRFTVTWISAQGVREFPSSAPGATSAPSAINASDAYYDPALSKIAFELFAGEHTFLVTPSPATLDGYFGYLRVYVPTPAALPLFAVGLLALLARPRRMDGAAARV